MTDIKETTEAMTFGISLAMAVDSATQDGFQWTDIFNLVPPLTQLPAAIEGIEKVPAEIADLDDDERRELAEAIVKLDFASDRSEEIAEQALKVGVDLAKLIMMIREFKG